MSEGHTIISVGLLNCWHCTIQDNDWRHVCMCNRRAELIGRFVQIQAVTMGPRAKDSGAIW